LPWYIFLWRDSSFDFLQFSIDGVKCNKCKKRSHLRSFRLVSQFWLNPRNSTSKLTALENFNMASSNDPHADTAMPAHDTSSDAPSPPLPPPRPPQVRHTHGTSHRSPPHHTTERHGMDYYPGTYHPDPNTHHPSDSGAHWHPPQYRARNWYYPPRHSNYYHPGAAESYPPEPPQLPEAFHPPRHEYATQTPSLVTPVRRASELHASSSQPRSHHDVASAAATSPFREGAPAGASPHNYSGIIWDVQPSDILCGRGAPTNYHYGNEAFRKLVKDYQTVYLCAKRSDKPRIAAELLQLVHSRGGRFLRRVKTSHHGISRYAWEELVEQRSYEKVCQALREGAPELRRKMMATSKIVRSPDEKENYTNSSSKHDDDHFRYHPDDSHPHGFRG
jgi:hypothetical protein